MMKYMEKETSTGVFKKLVQLIQNHKVRLQPAPDDDHCTLLLNIVWYLQYFCMNTHTPCNAHRQHVTIMIAHIVATNFEARNRVPESMFCKARKSIYYLYSEYILFIL